MKSRTLITLMAASAFGWSAGAYAGPGHEVQTPFSVTENGPNIVGAHDGFGSGHVRTAATSSDIVAQDTGYLQLSDASDWSASFEQMAEADTDGRLVTWTPVAVDGWDYYVLDMDSSDQLAMGEETYVIAPIDHIALVPGDDLMLSQEDQVAILLSESPVLDTAEVG
jgi:ABC-type proline/glycine betaine transport system substrate-binding protein